MRHRLPAFAVHLFTAIGAVLAFQALIAAAAHSWEAAFAWLGVALAVDAADGPIARRIGVKEKLPRFSGERLDLIVDYLTYVFVPAYIIYEAQLMPAYLNSVVAAALVLLSALFHFSDLESKTGDGYFVGFPALWNVVALYFFVFPMPPAAAFAVLLLLVILTLVPFKWVHPIRARRLRPFTLAVVTAWGAAVTAVLAGGFPGPAIARATLAISGVYVVGVGLMRSFRATADTEKASIPGN